MESSSSASAAAYDDVEVEEEEDSVDGSSVVVEEDSDSEWDDSEDDEDDEDNEEYVLQRGRTLLWLCQEGQIKVARRRFEILLEKNEKDQLKREVFQVAAHDRNYALHEILMGGTNDRNAYMLTEQILEFGKDHLNEFQAMLSVRPPSHRRTALHWAAWGNASLEILRPLVRGNPEALVIQDRSGNRTPLEILRHYYVINRNDDMPLRTKAENDKKCSFIESATKSWTQHRLRLAVYKAAYYHFVKQQLTPFDKKDRKITKIKPRAWFLLSVLGSLLQRQMQPLVSHILGFVGNGAKIHKHKKRKRKRKS